MQEEEWAAPVNKKPDKQSNLSKSLSIKVGLLLLIFVLLQIPLLLIQGVMEERQKYNVDYPQQYNGPGAKQQTIIGPVLTVPYEIKTAAEKPTTPNNDTAVVAKPKVVETGNLHFFPESLTVNGNLTPEIRDEGKFKSILYSTALQFKGTFDTGAAAKKGIKDADMNWQDAFVTFGVSDLRGIRKETIINWDGHDYNFSPGVNGLKLFTSGQHALLTDSRKGGSHKFSCTITVNGSRDLNVFPAGKNNRISLGSPWNQPLFTGGFLPTEKSVTTNGFKSLWEVSYFSRNLPQLWTDKDPDMKNSLSQYMVGVTLATPVEFYRTAIRAIKYGNLFIAMTFLTFLIFEFVTKLRIHEMQYGLVGLALCLFFLMLIAITEWIPFMWAYILASVPTIAQISWYIQAFSKRKSKHLWQVAAAVLTALYGYLYILLEMENFSLLVGAIGLFIGLSIVLFVTRNIDWYGRNSNTPFPDNSPAFTD
jgi:inner membrane protein